MQEIDYLDLRAEPTDWWVLPTDLDAISKGFESRQILSEMTGKIPFTILDGLYSDYTATNPPLALICAHQYILIATDKDHTTPPSVDTRILHTAINSMVSQLQNSGLTATRVILPPIGIGSPNWLQIRSLFREILDNRYIMAMI